MLKLLPILFLAVINTANVNIFEIEGIFSSGHINALERYVEDRSEGEKNLFVVQYNASDVNVNSIDELQTILNNMDAPKAIWVGPNKREVDLSVLRNFDFVGLSPGSIITNNEGLGLFETICEINTCTNKDVLITAEEGIYEDYGFDKKIERKVQRLPRMNKEERATYDALIAEHEFAKAELVKASTEDAAGEAARAQRRDPVLELENIWGQLGKALAAEGKIVAVAHADQAAAGATLNRARQKGVQGDKASMWEVLNDRIDAHPALGLGPRAVIVGQVVAHGRAGGDRCGGGASRVLPGPRTGIFVPYRVFLRFFEILSVVTVSAERIFASHRAFLSTYVMYRAKNHAWRHYRPTHKID